MQIKKTLGWAFIVFLGWMLLTRPTSLGTSVHHIQQWFQGVGMSVAKFLNSL